VILVQLRLHNVILYIYMQHYFYKEILYCRLVTEILKIFYNIKEKINR